MLGQQQQQQQQQQKVAEKVTGIRRIVLALMVTALPKHLILGASS